MKRSSISLVIIEMQIKPTKRYHYTAIKWLKKRKEVRKEGKKGKKGARKASETEENEGNTKTDNNRCE